jgi:hypothetical protein
LLYSKRSSCWLLVNAAKPLKSTYGTT